MCYCGDGDYPDIYDLSTPIARKKHICCECGSDIDKGEKYQKIKGLWDGDWLTFKTCMICVNVRQEAELKEECNMPFECLYEIVGSTYEYAGII